MVWKLEREKSKRRVHGGKGAGGEMVRNFLAKLHSNYFRVVQIDRILKQEPTCYYIRDCYLKPIFGTVKGSWFKFYVNTKSWELPLENSLRSSYTCFMPVLKPYKCSTMRKCAKSGLHFGGNPVLLLHKEEQ